MNKKSLGVLGGVGPLATMFVGEMIVKHTVASADQEHIDMIITNNTNIPDRTAFILGESDENPVPVIISDAERLKQAGAEVLIIPCNTAHSFYEKIQHEIELPVIHMIQETAQYVRERNAKRVGILGTTGTISTGIYQRACEELGMEAILPSAEIQDLVMSLIYDDIKAGKPAPLEKWKEIQTAMINLECDEIILGCTELSIVRKELELENVVDSLLVLAKVAIEKCGYTVK